MKQVKAEAGANVKKDSQGGLGEPTESFKVKGMISARPPQERQAPVAVHAGSLQMPMGWGSCQPRWVMQATAAGGRVHAVPPKWSEWW